MRWLAWCSRSVERASMSCTCSFAMMPVALVEQLPDPGKSPSLVWLGGCRSAFGDVVETSASAVRRSSTCAYARSISP